MFFKKKDKKKVKSEEKNLSKNFQFSFLQSEEEKIIDTKNEKKEKKEEKVKKKKENKFSFSRFFVAFFILIILGYITFAFLKARVNRSAKIDTYEVNIGEIIKYSKETGVIYRTENVYKAKDSGYINFLSLSNNRVSKDSLVYILNDENKYSIDNTKLSDDDYETIMSTIKNYINNTNDLNFNNVYTYNETLNMIIAELNMIDNLKDITNSGNIEVKAADYAKDAGIISYYIDGFEERNELDFNQSLVDKRINMKTLKQSAYVNKGEEVYKIITSPDYDIVFESTNDYGDLVEKDVQVKFTFDDLYANCKLTSFYGNDGKRYYKLTLNKYLEKYLDRRVLEFEIINNRKKGYKIPNTAIILKNCYKIPSKYIFKNEYNNDTYIKKIVSGNIEEVNIEISKRDENYYYITTDENVNNIIYGDTIVANDESRLQLTEIEKLSGIYNINKGYAIFKNIEILEQANEWTVIDKDKSTEISLYDHIALEANKVKEGDLIS